MEDFFMSAEKKVLVTVAATMAVIATISGTEIASGCCTGTANPLNLYAYLQFKNIVRDLDDRTDFGPVKDFVDSHGKRGCLISVQKKDILGNLNDEFHFFKSENEIPENLKNDSTRLKNWDAVKRYIKIKKQEKKAKKAKEKEREAQFKKSKE